MNLIPFDKEESLSVTAELRKYLAFYSAGTYIKNIPTPELDLKSVDINGTMDAIEKKINDGEYKNAYAAYYDMMALFGDIKDGHTIFYPTCVTGAFAWVHDHPLTMVAKTPSSIPEMYTVQLNLTTGAPPVLDKKVAAINGEKPGVYIEKMARTSLEGTWIDPDARFNQMLVQVSNGAWSPGVFALRFVYPEEIVITFEDGSEVEVEWKAIFLNPRTDSKTNPIPFHDAATFKEAICMRPVEAELETTIPLGLSQTTTNPANTTSDADQKLNKRAIDSYWPSVISYIGGKGGSGQLAYYEKDSKTAVIIATSFTGTALDGEDFFPIFSDFVASAIERAKSNGMERLLLDLTGNPGGTVALGQNMARQLFPRSDKIFFGSNMHWNPALDAMLREGNSTLIESTIFALSILHKQDGSDFEDMAEMIGPVYQHNDYFTEISIPDEAELDTAIEIKTDYSKIQPFKNENIAIISSGMCGSTCAVFGEAMKQQGVKFVAFGGRPRVGPMQGIGGVKGSQVLEFEDISSKAQQLLDGILDEETQQALGVPNLKDLAINTIYARVNYRNSWHKDSQFLPIEFLYDPAEYRLFYTKEMLQSVEAVHQAAIDVVWGDADNVSGGEYIPVNGLDGSGFKWPSD